MEAIIKAKFADLKNPVNEKVRTTYGVPLTGRNQFITVTDKEMTATVAQVMMLRKALPLKTRADYRNHILQNLYNQLIAGRYAEISQQADQPFLNGSAGISGFMGGLDAFNVAVTAKPGKLEPAFKAIWTEVERVNRFGFTATELERAKTAYNNLYENALKEKNKTNSESYVKQYMGNFLHETAVPGVDYEYSLGKSTLAVVTLEALNVFAQAQLRATDRNILVMAPETDKTALPNEATFNTWIKQVEQENILPYKDVVSAMPLLSVQPRPGKIVDEQMDEHTGITTLTLSNGIKVLLKKTDFKNDEIIFSGFAPGGKSLYSDAEYQSASASGLIPSFGAGNHTVTELQKYLSGKQASVNVSVGDRTQNVGGAATNRDLETALQLMYAYITAPRKDSILFNTAISRSKADLVNRMNDPVSVYKDTISAVLGSHSIRKTSLTLEKINQIDLNRAFEIFKERFADASGFTFVFVGNIDTISIRPLLEKYLGSLPALYKHEQARDLKIRIPNGIIERTVYKGTEPKATVNLVFSGDYNYSFKNNLKMSALNEALKIRLLERLREEEGGVYTPNTAVSTNKYPGARFMLTITFECAPQNVDKLIASSLNEIEKIKKEGPPQVNIDKFKAEDQHTITMALKTNAFWLGYLTGQLQNQEGLDQIDNYSAELKGITLADVKAMANQYLTGKNYIRLVLLPEKMPQ